MAPNPDRPDDFLIDSRPLQALLAEYGPRVTTASGGLGVSATRGEVWTPGGQSGGGGGAIWTPGSQAAPSSSSGEEKPRLIIPGRELSSDSECSAAEPSYLLPGRRCPEGADEGPSASTSSLPEDVALCRGR